MISTLPGNGSGSLGGLESDQTFGRRTHKALSGLRSPKRWIKSETSGRLLCTHVERSDTSHLAGRLDTDSMCLTTNLGHITEGVPAADGEISGG